jgi:hypothetical protein
VLAGDVPTVCRLAGTATIVRLKALNLIVPVYAAAAVLLWRAAWGHIVGGGSLDASVLRQVSCIVAMPFPDSRKHPRAVIYDPANRSGPAQPRRPYPCRSAPPRPTR